MRLGKRGVTSLEMALVLLAFLTMVLGAIDIGRYLFTVQSMVALVDQAGRYAVLNQTHTQGQLCAVGDATTSINNLPWPGLKMPPFLDPSATYICVGGNNDTANSLFVDVTHLNVVVTTQFQSFIPGLNSLTGPLTQTNKVSY